MQPQAAAMETPITTAEQFSKALDRAGLSPFEFAERAGISGPVAFDLRDYDDGFGYGGAINVIVDEDGEHDDDDAVVLDVSYHWTTKDQVRGQLKEKVPVKIGGPLDVELPGGCRLQASWRAAPRS